MRWPRTRARTRQVDGAGRRGDDRPGDDDLEPDPPLTAPGRAGALAAPVAAALAGAAVGMAIGGPVGALIGPPVGVVFRYIAERDLRAGAAAAQAVTQGAELAGMTPQQVADWAAADPRHLGLLVAVIEGAWRTLEDDRVDVLAQVLADGARDDARVNVNTLITRALQDLGPAHVQVLRTITDEPNTYTTEGKVDPGWPASLLLEHLPHLGVSVDALLSALAGRGMVYADAGRFGGAPPFYTPNAFGRACMEYLRGRPQADSRH